MKEYIIGAAATWLIKYGLDKWVEYSKKTEKTKVDDIISQTLLSIFTAINPFAKRKK